MVGLDGILMEGDVPAFESLGKALTISTNHSEIRWVFLSVTDALEKRHQKTKGD